MKKGAFHYVLLSDVVASRFIKERKPFEKKLDEAINITKQQCQDAFAIPMRIWKGLDETAAVISRPEKVYAIADSLNHFIAPEQMRFVLVKGTVDVMPADGDVAKADGPAFHEAAALMVQLKKEGLLFHCTTGDEDFDKAWKAQMNLLLLMKKTWTVQQRRIYYLYHQSSSQEEVAKTLQITQQAVSKTLKSIDAAPISLLEKDVMEWTTAQFKR